VLQCVTVLGIAHFLYLPQCVAVCCSVLQCIAEYYSASIAHSFYFQHTFYARTHTHTHTRTHTGVHAAIPRCTLLNTQRSNFCRTPSLQRNIIVLVFSLHKSCHARICHGIDAHVTAHMHISCCTPPHMHMSCCTCIKSHVAHAWNMTYAATHAYVMFHMHQSSLTCMSQIKHS